MRFREQKEYPDPPTTPHILGVPMLVPEFQSNPFCMEQGYDNPLMYGTRATSYHPLWGIFRRNRPLYGAVLNFYLCDLQK
jgi:hypothetical protein